MLYGVPFTNHSKLTAAILELMRGTVSPAQKSVSDRAMPPIGQPLQVSITLKVRLRLMPQLSYTIIVYCPGVVVGKTPALLVSITVSKPGISTV